MSDSAETNQPTTTEDASTGVQRAKLNRGWVIKMLIVGGVAGAVSLWALFDATVAYPARGERASEWFEKSYLEAMQEDGRITRASIDEPEQQLDEDVEQLKRINELPSSGARNVVQTREAWLTQLKAIKKLGADRTAYPLASGENTPRTRLEALTTQLANKNQPKPLSAFDVTVQYMMFVGLGAIALLVFANMLRVAAQKYEWDPEGERLRLPDGSSITPADIEEFDKRKWDKYIIFLKIAQGHERHGGKELKLDLLRHAGLEEWVLTMEATATGSEEGGGAGAQESAPQDA